MAGFKDLKITAMGKKIINNLLSGESKINFSKVEIGDGDNDILPEKKEKLSHKILECQIKNIEKYEEDKIKLSFYFNNQDENLNSSFYFKELGIFITDTTNNEEFLFCYGNSKYEAEFIDIDDKEIIERYIDVIIFCGNADNVEITLNKDEIFVSEKKLEEILKKRVYHFNTVDDMKKNIVLFPGDVCQTLGYYEANDGGGGTYKIVDDDALEDDGGSVHELDNGAKAILIIQNNTLNIKQLGARPQDEENNKYDIAQYLQKYMNLLDRVKNRLKLYIPAGIWHCSGFNLARTYGFDIYGDFGFNLWTGEGTVITSLNDNQDYVLNIGNNKDYTRNFSLKNISITTSDFVYNSEKKVFAFSNIKQIKEHCLGFLYSMFGETDNLFFIKIKGKALNISSSWEVYFKLLNFRHINNLNDCVMSLGKADYTLMQNPNITACNFGKIMFEACHGDLIKAETGCNSAHNNFGTINFEDYAEIVHDGATYIALNDESSNYDDINAIHHAVINIEENAQFDNEINNIELNNFSTKYYLLNGIQYIYDTVIKMGYVHYTNPIINNVKCIGLNKNPKALLSKNNGTCSVHSSIIFNNLICDGILYNFIFDTDGFNNIIVNNNVRKQAKINRCHYNSFKDFRTNIMQMMENNKHRGNVVYNENAMCKDGLAVSLMNTVKYPTIPRDEIIIPMLGKKLHLRAKLPSSSKIAFGTQIIENGSVISTKNIDSEGTNDFKWYTIDYSERVSEKEIGNLTIKFFANNDIDFNSVLDCFYFE